MKTDDRLSGALQENILCLLCFDAEHAKIARGALKPQLFESAIFREVAGIALDFLDQFGEPVGDHLSDHLEHILKGEDTRKAASYRRVLEEMYSAKDGINGEYVIKQLHKFVRQQNLKSSLLQAVEAMEDGRIDEAELAMHKGLSSQAVAFERGLDLSNSADVGGLMQGELEEEGFNLGIKEFDRAGIIPRRKESMLFIAPRKRGKSWFATHCAKMAMLQRWSVVVITLEMSEKRYGVRLIQSFFAISRREAEVRVTRLVQGRDGSLQDIIQEQVERAALTDDGIKSKITTRARRTFQRRPPLVIKQFPTGSLTVPELEAWLDGLERFEGVTPDCLIVDYQDLMFHDIKNKRLELGQIGERLRGLAVRRNMALINLSQGNRDSEHATNVTADMAAEDISKLATTDTCITYSQTPAEKKLGLARLKAAAARNDADGFEVLISQSYATGQFCVDSVMMQSDYSPTSAAQGAQDDQEADGDDDDDRRGDRRPQPPRRSQRAR